MHHPHIPSHPTFSHTHTHPTPRPLPTHTFLSHYTPLLCMAALDANGYTQPHAQAPVPVLQGWHQLLAPLPAATPPSLPWPVEIHATPSNPCSVWGGRNVVLVCGRVGVNERVCFSACVKGLAQKWVCNRKCSQNTYQHTAPPPTYPTQMKQQQPPPHPYLFFSAEM